MCAVRCVGEMVFSGIAPGGQRNCRGDFETPTRAFRINAKSCGRLPIALPEVLSERGLRRTATTPKKWGWAGVRVVVLWEGEAAAEPSVCQARGSCGSAGASPSRGGEPRARGFGCLCNWCLAWFKDFLTPRTSFYVAADFPLILLRLHRGRGMIVWRCISGFCMCENH